MNELLAIIIIVVVCCAMFIAWLASMAACPDTMVDLLSGTRHRSTDNTTSPIVSKDDLVIKIPDDNISNVEIARSASTYSQMDGSHRQLDMMGKKLSMVPEVDEQLTIQSKVSAKHPTILRPLEEQ